jgi:hypothetical protein
LAVTCCALGLAGSVTNGFYLIDYAGDIFPLF